MPVNSTKIADLAKSYAAAWTARDGFDIAQHFEPTGQLIVNGSPATNPKSIADVAQGFITLFPDLHYMADDTRIAGANTLQSWTLYGHHSETNAFIKLSGWTTFTVSDAGKIQTAHMFYDPTEMKG
jgi:hypothetical protein